MIKKNQAFTLAEAMIVLVIIGVLAAILIPTLFVVSPDEAKIKAKKAYNTFSRAVETLTNSEVYSATNGIFDATSYIEGTTAAADNSRKSLFCNNLTELLNVKNRSGSAYNCSNNIISENPGTSTENNTLNNYYTPTFTAASGANPASLNYNDMASAMDEACESNSSNNDFWRNVYHNTSRFNFITSDGVGWGIQRKDFSTNDVKNISGVNVDVSYALVCFNTDNANSLDYTYSLGVRRDGKIVVGTKLQRLLEEDNSNSI